MEFSERTAAVRVAGNGSREVMSWKDLLVVMCDGDIGVMESSNERRRDVLFYPFLMPMTRFKLSGGTGRFGEHENHGSLLFFHIIP